MSTLGKKRQILIENKINRVLGWKVQVTKGNKVVGKVLR